MSNFKFQKTILAVSATAAMAGMLVGGQAFAQAKTEQGSIDITAKIITSTCVLDLGGTPSTASTAAKKTLDLGTFSLANASSIGSGSAVGNGVSVVLSLKESDNTAGCAAISTGKWDVLIDLPTTAYSTITSTLNNMTTGTTALTGITAGILRQVSAGAASYINFSSRSPIGILLSGSTTGPNLASTDTVTVTAQMFRGSGALAAGTYTATVPLTVVYK